MRIQVAGIGNVGRALISLIRERQITLESLGIRPTVVSVSDSEGTAWSDDGLDLDQVLKNKQARWRGFSRYTRGYSASDAIREIESDAFVELTPSSLSGEPGLSHIRSALVSKKNVVTANKTPLVLAFRELEALARRNNVRLLYEATVGAHLPVFCMLESCFKADRLIRIEGILNATTNFIIGEMEKGAHFQDALAYAVREGWAETNCSDDVDGTDAARKIVILANSLFRQQARLDDVEVEGVRDITGILEEAKKSHKKVKLICEISQEGGSLEMSVMPKMISPSDPLASVGGGDMALKFTFETSRQIFVSAQFTGVKQTAYAVLNDLVKLGLTSRLC